MKREEVESFLSQKGVEFTTKEIEHGVQLKAKTGETVNFFNSGSVTVQGRKTDLYAQLKTWKETGSPTSLATDTAGDVQPAPGPNKKVFVVYGHDKASRDGLELLLLRMGLEPVILGNLPAEGDTIIEKLEKYLKESGNIGYACVLLTPDDKGFPAASPEEEQYRARQNVILELGMVLGNLGRRRVAIIYKESVERPSDISGLIYIGFKEQVDEVKSALFKELQAAGYMLNPGAL